MEVEPPNVEKYFMPKNVHDPPTFIPKFKRVVFGTVAGIFATTIVHPIDLVKVRIMTYSERLSYPRMAKRILRFQGTKALFSGLSAGILRQATNTSVRLSVYNILYDRHKKKHNRPPNDREKVQIGVIAGAAGAFCGNPSEVVMVRLMVQSAPRAFNQCPDLTDLIKKPYEGLVDAISRIVREEGMRALWRAGSHTLARSVVLSAIQIGTYAKIRDYLLKREVVRGIPLHIITAMACTFIAGIITLPVDIVKTRYYKLQGSNQFLAK
ncbi:mitochondrial 2-oxoglutarate/malate carrier protein-like [Pectinophora gossypiella]|uniref:mitochondrial 2-oxoglutarate/malate carrier protein-like n=1 Tax=Pectinophora gossypiella TaxID=13191 RepID=UPI00214E2B11|nr:mitochondrial 2-oxoglutarate/malate carrier protein-like [Pectinophora gossypiella]